MEPLLKRSVLRSLILAVSASLAIYFVARTFFAVHEEVNIPPRAAFPVAAWSFPAVFLGSFLFFVLRRSRAGHKR